MKVLFLHSGTQDYLADSLFHGLRSLLGNHCVDVPRYDIMYATLSGELRSQLRGNGFTLYGLLPDLDLEAERFNWQSKVASFDIIVIANVWRQWEYLWNYRILFRQKKIVLLDGEDTPYLFPFNSYKEKILKNPFFFLTPLKNTYYFKREMFDGYTSRSLERIFGEKPLFHVDMPANVFPISFSIPKTRINVHQSTNSKLFQTHIVDEEVAKMLKESKFSSTGSDLTFFNNEEDYYSDLTRSKFGITTKRAGWDCLRHYEIAAAGAVLCFKNLHLKPLNCAPLGLTTFNCISYSSYSNLMEQIESLTEEEYSKLQTATLDWAHQNSTESKARYLLDIVTKEGGS